MPNQPLVSIVILCYNYGHFLPKAIDSALEQTLTDREVIVVDNGSTDDTPEVVQSYGDRIVGLRLEKNAGRSGGKNAGLRIAKGKYIQFLDADDTLMREKLERQIGILEDHDEVDIVYSDSIFVNEKREPIEAASKWYRERHFKPDESFLEKMIQECFLLTHDGLIRRYAIDAIGGFDESRDMLEDWDFWLRLAIAGKEFFHLPEVLSAYYFHSASITKDPAHVYTLRRNFVYKYTNDLRFEKALGSELFNLFQKYQHRVLARNLYNLGEWRECRSQIRISLKSGGLRFDPTDLTLYFKSLIRGARKFTKAGNRATLNP